MNLLFTKVKFRKKNSVKERSTFLQNERVSNEIGLEVDSKSEEIYVKPCNRLSSVQ